MTNTHDDNAATWRDLTDALTPEQIAYLEHWESRPDEPPMANGKPAPYGRHQAGLLFAAREMVGSNAAAVLLADIAPPSEAGQHYQWQDDGQGNWARYFVGTTRTLGDAHVVIHGHQSSNGAIARTITTSAIDDLDAQTARQLGTMLIEAADELDALQ